MYKLINNIDPSCMLMTPYNLNLNETESFKVRTGELIDRARDTKHVRKILDFKSKRFESNISKCYLLMIMI